MRKGTDECWEIHRAPYKADKKQNKVVKVDILWLMREESELLGLELLFALSVFLV